MAKANLYRVKKRRISLTALIDVVFILLLFFMLTTSFSQWRAIDVSTATSSETDSNKKTMNFLLMPNEVVSLHGLNKTFTTYKDIKKTDLTLAKKGEILVLLPHQDVPLQLLIDAMQHFKKIGLESVSIGHSFGEEINLVQNVGDV